VEKWAFYAGGENGKKAQNNVFFSLHHHNISGIIFYEIYAFWVVF
jgi:hypothetical protein